MATWPRKSNENAAVTLIYQHQCRCLHSESRLTIGSTRVGAGRVFTSEKHLHGRQTEPRVQDVVSAFLLLLVIGCVFLLLTEVLSVH